MKNHILPVAILILICIALFANTLGNDFIWDDEILITKDASIRKLSHIPFFFTPTYWKHYFPGTRGHYRPMRTVTFALDHFAWGLNPLGYHLTNLALHTCNVILIYFLCLQLVSDCRHCEPERSEGEAISKNEIASSPRPGFSGLLAMTIRYTTSIPFITAALFAAHPVHTESVSWIKNRSDLITSLFLLASFIFFSLFARGSSRKARGSFLAASCVSFLLSIASKEMALSLPLLLAFYTLFFLPKKDWKRCFSGVSILFFTSVSYLIFKITALGTLLSSANTKKELLFFPHLLLVFKTIGRYTRLLLAPFDLNAEHLIDIPQRLSEPGTLIPVILCILLILLAIVSFRRSKLISFSLLWIIVSLIPASNIIFLSGRPIAEQRLYIPSFGFCLFMGVSFHSLLLTVKRDRSRIFLIALLSLLFLSYSYSTFMRNFDWKDSLTFWKKTAISSPNSDRAHYNLGNAYTDNSSNKSAIAEYLWALEINPLYKEAHTNLGFVYGIDGKNDEAIASLLKALEIDPLHIEALNNLGNIYTDTGKIDKALTAYTAILKIDPYHAGVYHNLGVLYKKIGDREQAVEYFREELKRRPDSPQTRIQLATLYNERGLYYHQRKNAEKAIGEYRNAIKTLYDYSPALSNLGALYGMVGKPEEAISLLKQCIEADPDNTDAYGNLALTYYKTGQYALAVEYCDRAAKRGITINPQLLKLLEPHREQGARRKAQGASGNAL
ncbi:MAG: tetratricopeptide repeat protein [Candidatus Omnitrophota bacterium]